MKAIGWAIVASVASCAVIIAAGAPPAETFFGMLGPVIAVAGTALLVERAHRIDPASVTSALLAAFVVKFVFFGGYVVAMTRVLELDAVPFVASFGAYFIGLYAVQATVIRGLATRQASSSVS